MMKLGGTANIYNIRFPGVPPTWGVSSTDRGLTLSHAGSNTMWYAWAVIEVDQDRAWLATTNAANSAATRAVSRMVDAMVEHDEDGAW